MTLITYSQVGSVLFLQKLKSFIIWWLILIHTVLKQKIKWGILNAEERSVYLKEFCVYDCLFQFSSPFILLVNQKPSLFLLYSTDINSVYYDIQ